MSYCRWSCIVPELSPNVDCSLKKMLSLIVYEGGGYAAYRKYLKDNAAVYSEAYVYEDFHGNFVCHWKNGEYELTDTAGEMAELLSDAIKKGKRVPQSAIDELLKESINEEGEINEY